MRSRIFACLVVLTAGCPASHLAADAGPEPVGDAGGPEVTGAGDDCEEAAAALRSAGAGCCEAYEVDAKLAELASWCRPDGMRVHADRLASCLERRRALWARCEDTVAFVECRDAFEPARGQGEPCSGEECIEGLRCVGEPPQATCVPFAGSPCDETCESAAFECVEGVCTARLGAGEACDPDLWPRCETDFACDPEERRCVLLPGAGEPCSPLPTFCRSHHLCAGGTCVRWRAEGEECAADVECGDGVCDAATGRCTPVEGPLCWLPCDDCED